MSKLIIEMCIRDRHDPCRPKEAENAQRHDLRHTRQRQELFRKAFHRGCVPKHKGRYLSLIHIWTLLPEIGTFLERKKYRIKCLNLINFRKSMKNNPLAYIRSEKDILKLVNALIMNTKGEGEKSSEDFWVKAERLYYSALIGYIWYCLLYTSRCV